MDKKSHRRPLWHRLLLIGLVLAFFAGLGATFFWVYERGLKREGLFERAQRALREQRYDDAARLAEETIVSQPNHPLARELLLETLFAAERLDEAEVLARRYLEEDGDRDFAAVRLCQLALQRGDVQMAERLARTLADRRPAFAYRVLALIADHRGLLTNSWRQRFAAAETMRGLTALTESDQAKAEAFIFSASVSLEILPLVPNREAVLDRVRTDLEQAVSHVNAAKKSSRSFQYDLAMGRIRVLAENEEEAALGAETLRPYTQGALRSDQAIAALVKYYIQREEWSEAVDLVRELKDLYLWNRIFWVLRHSGRLEEAVRILEAGPLEDGPERTLLRAELLLRSPREARQAEGRQALAALAGDAEVRTSVVLRALLLLAVNVDLAAARGVAEEAAVMERNDPRITALVAALLTTDEKDKERGLELARTLAQQTDDAVTSRDLMGLLNGSDGEAFDRYVEAQVNKGGETGLQHRLQRAMTTLARARREKGKEKSSVLRARVVQDLETLRDEPLADKASLAVAFNLAASVGEVELAGALLGRALARPGVPDLLDVRVLRLAYALKDDEVLARLAAGLRSAAQAGQAKAFLEVLAETVRTRDQDFEALQARLEEAAREEGSRGPALELASRVAYGRGEFAGAERLARACWTAEPDRRGALELLGSTLLRRGAFDDVLALYEGRADLPEIAFPQIVGALFQLGRKDEALVAARKAVRLFPRSAGAHILLARLYLDLGEPRRALSVLNLAPLNTMVVHMRAELLRDLGDEEMARRLYELLLSHSRFRDLNAWRGLLATLTGQKRTKEFVVLCGRALDSSYLKEEPKVRASLHYMRGMCLEIDGKIEEALADYEEAIREDDTHWSALNNAAWQIALTSPARIDVARGYIDRALKLKPEQAPLMDTAAEVHSLQKDHDGALRLIDRAIALGVEVKVRSYTVHKAEILLRAGREKEAESLLKKVRGESTLDEPARRARELLWEIERRRMPDEEPAPLPVLPEDEEETPGNGGGE